VPHPTDQSRRAHGSLPAMRQSRPWAMKPAPDPATSLCHGAGIIHMCGSQAAGGRPHLPAPWLGPGGEREGSLGRPIMTGERCRLNQAAPRRRALHALIDSHRQRRGARPPRDGPAAAFVLVTPQMGSQPLLASLFSTGEGGKSSVASSIDCESMVSPGQQKDGQAIEKCRSVAG